MRGAIVYLGVLTLVGCAHALPGPDELDPDVLELQVTVLDHVLRESQNYLQESSIERVCVVGAIRTRRLGRRTWAGDREERGEGSTHFLVDRLVAVGWDVVPAQECELDGGRWLSRTTGEEVALASAAGIDWASDTTVFVDAGLAQNARDSFRYSCTVDRTRVGWAVRECESGRSD